MMSSPDRDYLLAVGAVPLTESGSHDCGYLAGRIAREEAYFAWNLPGDVYHDLMNRNFRRSGPIVYRPRCADCDRCRQIRVPVDEFRPTRSQRRCRRRNQDVELLPQRPTLTREKIDLYSRYLSHQHPAGEPPSDEGSLDTFLYSTCVDTIEIEYRAGGRLLGVSIVDRCEESLSSVYHFFEPAAARRSLGTFSILAEIELCRRDAVPYYYLGYWVEGCAAMEYKARFHPHEILVGDEWTRGIGESREADS